MKLYIVGQINLHSKELDGQSVNKLKLPSKKQWIKYKFLILFYNFRQNSLTGEKTGEKRNGDDGSTKKRNEQRRNNELKKSRKKKTTWNYCIFFFWLSQ